MSTGLEGKVALVTGAAQGIGLATVKRLLADGAIVYAADVKPVSEGADSAKWLELDVTDDAAWAATISLILTEHDRLDVLVNNAGMVHSYDSITDIKIQDWWKVIEVNQFGVFLGMRHAIPHLISGGGGAIVNVSSIWGLVGADGVSAYQASKGAVTMMSRNAATTYATSNVRVNSVHPGFIWTPMTVAQDAEISDRLIALTPMARAGEAHEIADAIAFLCSDRASFVTGVQLPIDGGFTAV